jgi:hypothetical protein
MRTIVASLMVMAGTVGAASANPLAQFVDHTRVLVISAPRADSDRLRQQDQALRAYRSEIATRDLVEVRLVGADGEGAPLGGATAAEIRRALGLRVDRFSVALVGKDGGVKLRSYKPVAAEELFRTIDAMPMRQAEMRKVGR